MTLVNDRKPLTNVAKKVHVKCCGDLRYNTDSFNCFIILQRKGSMKFTGILFGVSEELLTVKTT